MILKMANVNPDESRRRLVQLCGKNYEVSSVSVKIIKKFYQDNDNHDYYWDSKEHNWILKVDGLAGWNFEKELARIDDEQLIDVIYVYDEYTTKEDDDQYFLQDAEQLLAGLPKIEV